MFLFWAPLGLTNPTPETSANPQYLNNEIDYLKKLIQLNADQMEILRRDQVNYKLEKDLLEKAYSAYYQNLNIVMALIVAALGGVGVLSVRSLKEDYKNELDKLTDLKVKLEKDINEVVKLKDSVANLKDSVEDLSSDISMKLMDIIEKAVHHQNNHNWPWAMAWVSKGLLIDPENLTLLDTKKRCLFYLGQWSDAADTCKKRMELSVNQPDHMQSVFELLEMLALNKDDRFEKYYQTYKPAIDAEYNYGLVADFLRLLKTIIDDDLNKTRDILTPMCSLSGGAIVIYGFEPLWSLEFVRYTLQSLKTPIQQKYLNTVINFYSGAIDSDGVKQILWPQEHPTPETSPLSS